MYIVTYERNGKRRAFHKFYETQKQAKNRVAKMYNESYYKNPRVKKII